MSLQDVGNYTNALGNSVTLLGCYADYTSNRTLPYIVTPGTDGVNLDLLTPQICNSACYAAGSNYFGVEYSRESVSPDLQHVPTLTTLIAFILISLTGFDDLSSTHTIGDRQMTQMLLWTNPVVCTLYGDEHCRWLQHVSVSSLQLETLWIDIFVACTGNPAVNCGGQSFFDAIDRDYAG